MKQFIKKFTAFTASAVIAVCSAISSSAIGADTKETPTFLVHFDLSEEGVSIAPDEDGNVPEIKDLIKNPNSTFFIPEAKLQREGYSFTGWTEDDVKGYVGGDVFRVKDHDVTLKPVWSVAGDSVFHTITYRVEWNGEIDKDAEKLVPPAKRQTGKFVSISAYSFPREGYKQRGWTDGENEFAGGENMIVHDEDVTLYPNLKKLYNLRYSVGDADRINGITELVFEIAEGEPTNLQNTDRFSRNGFKTVGWHCENDGKDYDAVATFIMPCEDVLITPIWEPIQYTINFKPSNNSSDNIKVRGLTDTAITVPECTYVKEGYTFAGWQYQDTVCQPGEEFVIPGAEPGIGISFKAIWIEDSVEQTTTTTTTSAETTTTTTTATTTKTTVSSDTTSTTTSTETATTTTATSTTSTTTTSVTTTSTTTSVTSTTEKSDVYYGDSNCDGAVDMADAVLIMQSLANPNKYGVNGSSPSCLTAAGKLNADVDQNSPGVTTGDALLIQKYLLGLVEKLPLL